MNISHATDHIFRFNHVEMTRYFDKLRFIIFVRWRCRIRNAPVKKLSLLAEEQFVCLH